MPARAATISFPVPPLYIKPIAKKGPPMLFGLLQFVDVVLSLVIFVMIAQVIVSWLLAFNILNMSNQFVATIANALWQLTNPLLSPIRRMLPNFGGLDISPIVLFLAIYFIRLVVLYPLMRQVAMQGL